jgi:adenylate kinase
VEFKPPRQAGRCDADGESLVQRPDDTEEVIRRRLAAYDEQTRPVADYYRQAGLLRPVEGLGSADVVWQRLEAVVAGAGG